jgi:hypothetical protein
MVEFRRKAKARHQPGEIPSDWRQNGFVEIIYVEIGLAIVPFVTAEILQVQVAANPGCGRPVKRGRLWSILVEEMACPAEEAEVVTCS